MLCDICHLRDAIMKFTQILNTEKKELNICKVCAEESGLSNPLASTQKLFESMLVFNQLANKKTIRKDEDTDEKRCDVCGTSWLNFQESGLLGCMNCYHSFRENLNVLLRRIHGSNKHIGNRPPNQRIIEDKSDITNLQQKLKIAIENENFEKAAELRDRITDLKMSKK